MRAWDTVIQHQRPAVNACNCIKCKCACACVASIVQQAWLRRRPAGEQTGSQIIGLCSGPNTNSHTHTHNPVIPHTVLTGAQLLRQSTKTGRHSYTSASCISPIALIYRRGRSRGINELLSISSCAEKQKQNTSTPVYSCLVYIYVHLIS